MTDNIKRSKGKFDYLTETRDWSSAATEDRCRRIARNKGKRLAEPETLRLRSKLSILRTNPYL
jgi:hypothetical protein